MLLTIFLCVLLVGIDQLIKLWAVKMLAPLGSMPFVPHIMELRYVENNGAAFNLLAGHQLLLTVFTGAVLLFGAYVLLFRRPKEKLVYIAIVMVFSGGLGNWIDRIVNGFVVDYLATLFMNFAVFNFADILVVVGVGLMVIAILRTELQEREQEKHPVSMPANGKNDVKQQSDDENHGQN